MLFCGPKSPEMGQNGAGMVLAGLGWAWLGWAWLGRRSRPFFFVLASHQPATSQPPASHPFIHPGGQQGPPHPILGPPPRPHTQKRKKQLCPC